MMRKEALLKELNSIEKNIDEIQKNDPIEK